MANVYRYRRGATNPVTCPVDSGTVIEIGDALFYDTNDVKPADQISYGASLVLTQELFHDEFIGIAMQQSRSGDTKEIRVATSGVFEMIAASATFEVGVRVGMDDNAGGDELLNQTVIAVALAAPQAAIGRVAKRVSSAATVVEVSIKSTKLNDGPQTEA